MHARCLRALRAAMSADALGNVLSKRTAKTHRGKKHLRDREPKVVEEGKTALIIRGSRTSQEMTDLLRDLFVLRTPLATLFQRKHEEHPFEDCKRLQQLCNKFDHSLFAFGSSSKKRPARLILGRLFDGSLLDMQEFSIEDFKSTQKFKASHKECTVGSKPLVVFQGSAFDHDDRMKRAKSLIMDFFGVARPDKVLLSGMEHVIVCTSLDSGGGPAAASTKDKILFRRYRLSMGKSGSKLPRVELEETGPSFSLSLDRCREPDKDRWKQAIKVPKAAKPKKVKNIKTNELGKQIGKFHLGKQDFNQIHTVHHGESKKRKLRAALGSGAAKKTKAGDSKEASTT